MVPYPGVGSKHFVFVMFHVPTSKFPMSKCDLADPIAIMLVTGPWYGTLQLFVFKHSVFVMLQVPTSDGKKFPMSICGPTHAISGNACNRA